MRVAVILAAAGACAARAPEPLQLPVVARGEVPAPPLPAFGGIDRMGVCALELRRASEDELRARTAAVAARLPRGARFALSPLGDRVQRLTMPIAVPATTGKKRVRAGQLAGRVVRDTALLWGIAVPTAVPRPDADADDGRTFEFLFEPVAYGRAQRIRLVVRVDLGRGSADAGLVDDALPIVPVCDGPDLVIDRARVDAAVLGEAAQAGALLGHGRAFGPGDLGDPETDVEVDRTAGGRDVIRTMVLVPIGPDLAARPPGASPIAGVTGVATVDPRTMQVVSIRGLPQWTDDDFSPDVVGDAARALAPW